MQPATVVFFALTIASSSQDFTRPPEEGEWFSKVEEVRLSLPVLKKYNEFYVAVENAKLKKQENCVREFEPRVQSYAADIDDTLNTCRKFVPQGSVKELKDCASSLGQPILSEIETNLFTTNGNKRQVCQLISRLMTVQIEIHRPPSRVLCMLSRQLEEKGVTFDTPRPEELRCSIYNK